MRTFINCVIFYSIYGKTGIGLDLWPMKDAACDLTEGGDDIRSFGHLIKFFIISFNADLSNVSLRT